MSGVTLPIIGFVGTMGNQGPTGCELVKTLGAKGNAVSYIFGKVVLFFK
jgi:hypothetical protein